MLATKFFPETNPTAAFLSTLATFAAGFVVRPFGALFFGRLGDMIGRKYTFMVTLLLMGGATFAIGLIPSYATIGFLAPLLVLVLRLLQGLALGIDLWPGMDGLVFGLVSLGVRVIAVCADYTKDAHAITAARLPCVAHAETVEQLSCEDFRAVCERRNFSFTLVGGTPNARAAESCTPTDADPTTPGCLRPKKAYILLEARTS